MNSTYFSDDGSYGDGDSLVILENSSIPDKVWDLIDECRDNDRYEVARAIYVGDMETLHAIANEYDIELDLEIEND